MVGTNNSFLNVSIGNKRETLRFAKNRRVAKECPCGKSNKDGKFAPWDGFTDKGYCHSCGDIRFPDSDRPPVSRFQWKQETKAGYFHKKQETKPISLIDDGILENTLCNYDKNNFIKYLVTKFGRETALQLADEFFIGTEEFGRTIFPQIDYNINVRQLKVMDYNPVTGKRTNYFNQLGKHFLGEDARIEPCFFNEFSLNRFLDKVVGICESEKSCVIASIYFPELVWIATGGKNGIKRNCETLKVLEGRTVILFPDTGAYDEWKEFELLIKKSVNCKITTSDLLEKTVGNQKNLDIADFLIKQDSTGMAINDYDYPVIWDLKTFEGKNK